MNIKYNYDIKKIERLQNKGFSISKIAEMNGWGSVATHAWINRNYKKKITFIKK
jgi:hypothetical protein